MSAPDALLPFQPGPGLPLHQQVEAWLRHLLRLPAYAEGQTLPDEVSLALRLGVSRSTLRLALNRLEQDGLVERRPKLGTRAVAPRQEHRLDQWFSFRAEMRLRGIEVEDLVVQLTELSAEGPAAEALGVSEGTLLQRLRRVRGWGGEPRVLSDSWLPPTLTLGPEADLRRPLYELLREAGARQPARSREEIGAQVATKELRGLLGLEAGSALLVRRRQVLDKRGRPIEYNVNWYRADRYTLRLDLPGGGCRWRN